MTVKLQSSQMLIESAAIIWNILSRRHFNNDDFSIIILGFDYYVFIFYRQKDNKADNWATEFVVNIDK